MEALACPAFALRATTGPTRSKLGGSPDLPDGLDWPEAPQATFDFLAQLDLAALRAVGGPHWLPDHGMLYVFVDNAAWGLANPLRLLYSPHQGSRPAAGRRSRYGERRVAFHHFTATPSLEWLDVDYRGLRLGDAEVEALSDLARASHLPAPMHQVGGFPDEISEAEMVLTCEHASRSRAWYAQNRSLLSLPVDLAAAARSWRLLLQIDSDPELGMTWEDGGLFQVFVREEDAGAGDFTRPVTIIQPG